MFEVDRPISIAVGKFETILTLESDEVETDPSDERMFRTSL